MRETITLRRPPHPARSWREPTPDYEFEALITEREWMDLAQVKRSRRDPCPLALFKRHSPDDDDPLCGCRRIRRALDHGRMYNRAGRPVVIVGQPYGVDEDCFDELATWRAAGLTVWIHARSWHYPGHTVRVEVWAPGVPPLRGDDYPGTHGDADESL